MSKQSLIIFYISIFVLFSKISSQESTFIIKEIFSYKMNATAAYLSLSDLNIKKYAYFSFDFSNCNIAYFKITTESSLSHSNIQLLFSNKDTDKINQYDLENNYAQWFFIRGYNFKKEKTEQGFDSYLKIEKYTKTFKTLIIKVDVDKLNGDITAENLESLPEDNSLNKNNYKEKENKLNHPHDKYNNDYQYNNNHNNYHNHEIKNNNQRDYKYYHYHQNWRSHSHDSVYQTNTPRIIYGLIISQIWMLVLILYCLVNRRKRNVQYAVAINNV